MGEEISSGRFTRADHARFRAKVQRCLVALERMLDEGAFDDDEWRTGLEIELNLVDAEHMPFFDNTSVLERISSPLYQTELGRFTIELNVDPRWVGGQSLRQLETALRKDLNSSRDSAGGAGADIVMIGALPTLDEPGPGREWFTDSERYRALDDAIMTARREPMTLSIPGVEPLEMEVDSIAAEAACTSTQLHLQITPGRYAAYWNAAQVLAGPQLAVGANSPYLFGRHVQAESRIELFAQATDIRPVELRNQGVRPLVFFGDRWITSIFDLFEENVNFYPTLLPQAGDEEPLEVLDAGGVPTLAELRLHNGTIYRWNRPIYDVQDGRPHLRLENRVLPAGPSVIDTLANAAFFYGLIVELVLEERPMWSRMSFEAARQNFTAAARDGIDAELYWPGEGELPVEELVLRHLLPMAQRGLVRLGVDAELVERYLGVIEGRARSGRNGASWQVAAVRAAEAGGASRAEALRTMLGAYMQHMHANEPVHTWPLP